jgi:hypothetical protein
MNGVRRLLTAFAVATAVTVAGVLIFEALGVGGLAYLGLILFATIVGSLFDREHFYGDTPASH